MIIVKDQMKRTVQLRDMPRRIVSLVPSITEMLIDFGVDVVGRTKFCIHPGDKVEMIPVIGGTKNFRFDEIDQLKPDLIIGNKEENYQEGIDYLSRRYPVWMSDITSISDAQQMMEQLAELLRVGEKAESWINKVQQSLNDLRNTQSGNVFYMIWKDPWMAAGPGTYIHHFIQHLGFTNFIKKERYPVVNDILLQEQPGKILLSTEPYPFQRNFLEIKKQFKNPSEVYLVDGEVFSWYGTRIAKTQKLFIDS